VELSPLQLLFVWWWGSKSSHPPELRRGEPGKEAVEEDNGNGPWRILIIIPAQASLITLRDMACHRVRTNKPIQVLPRAQQRNICRSINIPLMPSTRCPQPQQRRTIIRAIRLQEIMAYYNTLRQCQRILTILGGWMRKLTSWRNITIDQTNLNLITR